MELVRVLSQDAYQVCRRPFSGVSSRPLDLGTNARLGRLRTPAVVGE